MRGKGGTKEHGAIGEDEGITLLEENGKGGSERWRERRGYGVAGIGRKNTKKGKSPITKGTIGLHNEGN